MFGVMELMNDNLDASESGAERIFADPVGYLAALGIDAVLIAEFETRLPEAA